MMHGSTLPWTGIAKGWPGKWIVRHRIHAALFPAFGLILSAGAGSAAAPAGHVVGISGPCTVTRHAVHQGDAVRVNDTITVPPGGSMKLQMADQSVISIAPGSNLTVTRYSTNGSAGDAQLELAQGLLRLVVPPLAGVSTYAVSTSVGTAAMQSNGGDWFIDAQAGSLQAGVLHGSVALTSAATKQSVTIPSHWGTRLEAGLNPMLPRMWGQVEFDGFIRRTQCCGSPQQKPK
jgi:hypothetical protein